MPDILRVQLDEGAVWLPPRYSGDAGYDLVSRIFDKHGAPAMVAVNPWEFEDIGTGVRIALPDEYWAEIRGRSSAAWNKRLHVHPGVIDEGYRGELRVLVQNLNTEVAFVHHGERLAQLILHRRHPLEVCEVEILPPSRDGRGEAGFGSTG